MYSTFFKILTIVVGCFSIINKQVLAVGEYGSQSNNLANSIKNSLRSNCAPDPGVALGQTCSQGTNSCWHCAGDQDTTWCGGDGSVRAALDQPWICQELYPDHRRCEYSWQCLTHNCGVDKYYSTLDIFAPRYCGPDASYHQCSYDGGHSDPCFDDCDCSGNLVCSQARSGKYCSHTRN
jgi:hypothetical protein